MGRSSRVRLRNLNIQGCALSELDNVTAIVETETCPRRSTRVVQLRHVSFRRNVNLGGSVGLVVMDPTCYSLEMQDVQFRSNQYARSSELAVSNRLQNLRLFGNRFQGDAQNVPLISLPQNSSTNATGISARDNAGTVLLLTGGRLDIRRSNIVRNSGNQRGAIVGLSSTVVLSESVFDSNLCDGQGSAVSLASSSSGIFTSVQFVNNSGHQGGAIYSADPQAVQIQFCTFESNLARQDEGGAIHVEATDTSLVRSLEVSSCDFHSNSAFGGGGGISVHSWNNGHISINDSSVVFNSGNARGGNGAGGGLLVHSSANVTLNISNSRFESNTGQEGGGLSFEQSTGEIHLQTTNFTANQAQRGGGGLLVNLATNLTLDVSDSLFHQNTADEGGGVGLEEFAGEVRVRRTRFTSNAADDGGAALAVHIFVSQERQSVHIEDAVFENNTAVGDGNGGGLHVEGGHVALEIRNSAFARNQAADGGAVHLEAGRRLGIRNCRFERNRARRHGGAVWLGELRGMVILQSSTFMRNRAISGGAVHAGAPVAVYECRFESNAAERKGGALAVLDADIGCALSNSSFLGNAALAGGAVHFAGSDSVEISGDCRFEDNAASLYGGGLYAVTALQRETIRILDATFTRNNATLGGENNQLSFLMVCLQGVPSFRLTGRISIRAVITGVSD